MENKNFIIISEDDLRAYVKEYPYNTTIKYMVEDICEKCLMTSEDTEAFNDRFYCYDDLLKLIHDLTFRVCKDGISNEFQDNPQGAVIYTLLTFIRELNKINSYKGHLD